MAGEHSKHRASGIGARFGSQWPMRRALPVLLTAAALLGCDQQLDARVGGVVLPQANAHVPAGDGPVVVIKPGAPAPALSAGPVRLAVDLGVPWKQLAAVLDDADRAGARPTFLVGRRHVVHGFALSDELLDGYKLRFQTTGIGKFCMSPPGTREAYCVESADHRHISSMYVREAVQKAVAEYGIMQALVSPDDDARWGDVVRTVDGARTCCGDRRFRVAVVRTARP